MKRNRKELDCLAIRIRYWAFLVAQMVKNLPVIWETWVQSLVWKDLLEKDMATHSSILAGKFHGQISLVGYSPWGFKELDMRCA